MRLRHTGALLGAIAAGWTATAHGQLLVPLEPVAPDGFVVRSPQPVTAEGAAVTPVGGERFRVVPAEESRTVTLSAGAERRTLAVGPPATTVTANVTPAAPVKGRDTSATLEISVGVGAGSAPPVLRANVGEVGPVERSGPGRYTARYTLPTTRFPEVAVIVAFSAWPHPQSTHGALGVLRVPLASAVEVPGRAEPGAEMRLTIAGATFGPVTAGKDGSFRLPVVVPPGYGTATGQTVDRVGNRRKTTIDLRLPPTDQLACVVTPTRLPADGAARARVLCATSDRYGAAAKGARVQLTASVGNLSPPREVGPGVFEWAWVAPRQRGDGVARLDARWRQGANDSQEHLEIALGQGPVASLKAPRGDAVAWAGGRWTTALEALDALGRPVHGVEAAIAVPLGIASATPGAAAGAVQLDWKVPAEAPRGLVQVDVRAFGPRSDEPAQLLAWSEGEGPAARTWAAVTDLAGLPVAGQGLLVDARRLQTGGDGTVELGRLTDGEHVLRHAEWPGLKSRLVVRDGRLVFPVDERPPRVALRLPVTVGPPVPINVRLEREAGGVRWWLETDQGVPVAGRAVQLVVNGQPQRTTSGGPAHVDVATGSVSVQDLATRVTAAIEVAP